MGACPTERDPQSAKRRQKDTEARWKRKHGTSHFGYMNHVNVAKKHKLIRRYAVTDAAVQDSLGLEEILQIKTAGRDVWGNAAYRSETINN